MSYLVMHIDKDFIVGTVCADNGTFYPITNGKESLLWLYFFNNPHQNSISFGKDNKSHFNNLEVNYYGKFFEKIENEQEKFILRGIDHLVIDLLKESGLLELLKISYKQKTLNSSDYVPTLITFSSTIGDNAKQKTVEYLKKHGFQIDSYTIPLAELTCYHSLSQKALKSGTGSVAIFLEATNSSLHLMKLSLSDSYYLMDGKPNSWRGKGIDPRKRALARFIVNEVNKATGVLSSEDEKEDECERLETYAEEWLKRLDLQTRNMPLRIPSISFAKAPNMKRDVMVRKDDLDSDAGQYTQDIKDIYDVFKNDNVNGDVAAVFLLGDCFKCERVKDRFEQTIGKDKLHFYANNDIRDIIGVYPKIDINRYANEEARIIERAKTEELKQAEQRALENQLRKEKEAETKRQAELLKAEQNQKEAHKLFERAVELDKEGKLEDAKVNAENALLINGNNDEYKQFVSGIVAKISTLNTKNELYKSFLNKADNFLENDKLGKALDEYESAQNVFDNVEIRKKILDVKHLTQKKEKEKHQKENEIKIKIEQLKLEADSFFIGRKWEKAKNIYENIIKLDNNDRLANQRIIACEKISSLEPIINKADQSFSKHDYKEAMLLYTQGKPDAYCEEQYNKCTNILANYREIKQLMAELNSLKSSKNIEKMKFRLDELSIICKNIQIIDPSNNDFTSDLQTYKEAIERTVNKSLKSVKIEKPLSEEKRQNKEIGKTVIKNIEAKKIDELNNNEGEKLFRSGKFIDAKHMFENMFSKDSNNKDIYEKALKCRELLKYERILKAMLIESEAILKNNNSTKAKQRLSELLDVHKLYKKNEIIDTRIDQIRNILSSVK